MVSYVFLYRFGMNGCFGAAELLWGHIRFYGNGHLWFRSYSGSLGKAPSNQGLLPLSFGAEPRRGTEWRGRAFWLLCAGPRRLFQSA